MIEVTAGRAVAGGRCIARRHGKVMLVAGALPGERVRVRIVREGRRHDEAEVEAVLEAHPRRREPPCPHAGECGGCDFQHAERELQLSMKRSIVVDAFRRVGRIDVEDLLEGPEACGEEFGSRNRLTLTFDARGCPGLLRRGSHDVVAIDHCMLMPPVFGEALLPWLRLLAGWRRAGVRLDSDGVAVALLESPDPFDEPEREALARAVAKTARPGWIRGVLADGLLVDGERELRFHLANRELVADAGVFFQVNLAAADELLRVVDAFLGDDREGTLLDLYAGVGLFATCLGSRFEHVLAVESERRAAKLLERNLRAHGIRGEALRGSAERALRGPASSSGETVIVDPPRSGLSRDARRLLAARRPRRVVSISCDPATGARDAGELARAGYRLERLAAVDLFPVTAHVETAALLVRA